MTPTLTYVSLFFIGKAGYVGQDGAENGNKRKLRRVPEPPNLALYVKRAQMLLVACRPGDAVEVTRTELEAAYADTQNRTRPANVETATLEEDDDEEEGDSALQGAAALFAGSLAKLLRASINRNMRLEHLCRWALWRLRIDAQVAEGAGSHNPDLALLPGSAIDQRLTAEMRAR
jgi:hypothetical protein